MTSAPSPKEALELLPCPFCGGEPELLNGGPGNWFVRCTNCKCTTNDVHRDSAIQLWHRRAALATLPPAGERREAIARVLHQAHMPFCDYQYPFEHEQSGRLIYERLAYAILASGLVQDEAGWQPIETAPKDTLKVTSGTLLLAHIEKKWVRFGKWYVQEGCWYYSGTNERSQYAQVRGDDPTHWMPLPEPPIRSARDGGAES